MTKKRLKEIDKLLKIKEEEIQQLYTEKDMLTKDCSITCPHCRMKTKIRDATMLVTFTYNFDYWERTGHLSFWCDKCNEVYTTYNQTADEQMKELYTLMNTYGYVFNEVLHFCRSYVEPNINVKVVNKLREERR